MAVCLALVVRWSIAFAVQHRLDHVWKQSFVILGDAEGYWELGRRIAAGEEYSIYNPPRQVLRMPGYPLFLAASMRLFGESHLAARLLMATVGGLACGGVYLLGRDLFNSQTGLTASLLTAVSPMLAGFSAILLGETLFAGLLVLSLWAWWRMQLRVHQNPLAAVSRASVSWAIGCGLLMAAASFVRPSWLLVAPGCVLLWLLFEPRRWAVYCHGAVVLTVFGLCFVPWTLRNHAATGHWVVTTLWVGPSLYDGLNPQATGDSDMTFFERDALPGKMSEYEVDQHYRKEAWSFARENPARALSLAAAKFCRYWSLWPNARQFRQPLLMIAVSAFFVPVLCLAIYGVPAWCRVSFGKADWPGAAWWPLILTIGPILYFTGIHLLFVGSLRYRLPAEYPLYVLSAWSLNTIWARSQR